MVILLLGAEVIVTADALLKGVTLTLEDALAVVATTYAPHAFAAFDMVNKTVLVLIGNSNVTLWFCDIP